MIPVTKPFLPNIEIYQNYVDEIFSRQWLTNNGPLLNEFELKVKKYLDVKHFLFVSNGTIALQIAIKSLDLIGEIITTPFSYVATTSSIIWEGCEPVFVDIDKNSLNIDANKIEEAISDKTTAILATHCFGNACDIEAIDNIAKKHNLKVIYDAAHCFGTKYNGKSIFEYGDVTTTSFHATKIFHTVEGGGIFTNSAELTKKISWMRNFGHSGPEDFDGVGINGKNSEFHAAMGLANFNDVNDILNNRKKLSNYYDQALRNLNVEYIQINENCDFNFSYYPIIFNSEDALLRTFEKLKRSEIFPRRYFYPSLNKLRYVKNVNMPIAESISKRILCLPLYHELSFAEIDLIARILLRVQNYEL